MFNFIIGLSVGCCLGVFIMALLVAGSRGDQHDR